MSNTTEWIWKGSDHGLRHILTQIDNNIVKVEKDAIVMERSLNKAMTEGAKSARKLNEETKAAAISSDKQTKAIKGTAGTIDYLTQRLQRLEKLRDNISIFDENRIRRANVELKRTGDQIERLKRLGESSTMMGNSRSQMWQQSIGALPMGGSLMSYSSNPYVMAGMGAMATGSLISRSVRFGRNQNEEMAKINATAQMTPERLIQLRNSFLPTANKIGIDVNSIAGAYEGIISATGNKEEADRLLTPALKLAKGGFTDASITGQALSQISMTPGVNMTPDQIADMLMSAKNYGRGELKDFATYLPGLISTGKLRGFSEQDVTGSYSYLTRSNSPEQASTLMSNFMNVVLRKDVTDEIRKRIKVDVFEKDGDLRDMSSIIGDIGKAMNGLSDKGKQAFLDSIKVVDQQAFQALGALTADSYALNNAIKTVTDSAGVLNKTLEMSRTGNESLIQFNNNWAEFQKNISDIALPIANKGLEFINDGSLRRAVPMADITMSVWENLLGIDEKRKKEADMESSVSATAFAKQQAATIMSNFKNQSPEQQVYSALDQIRETMAAKGTKLNPMATNALMGYLQTIVSKPTLPGVAPDGSVSTTSESPDKVIRDHKQVRNVTINIENLQKIDSVSVSSTSELNEVTGEDLLNGLVKIVRDAEQSVNTY